MTLKTNWFWLCLCRPSFRLGATFILSTITFLIHNTYVSCIYVYIFYTYIHIGIGTRFMYSCVLVYCTVWPMFRETPPPPPPPHRDLNRMWEAKRIYTPVMHVFSLDICSAIRAQNYIVIMRGGFASTFVALNNVGCVFLFSPLCLSTTLPSYSSRTSVVLGRRIEILYICCGCTYDCWPRCIICNDYAAYRRVSLLHFCVMRKKS